MVKILKSSCTSVLCEKVEKDAPNVSRVLRVQVLHKTILENTGEQRQQVHTTEQQSIKEITDRCIFFRISQSA